MDMNNPIFGYPLLSWLPIILILATFMLSAIDNSRQNEKGRSAAVRKISIGLCAIAATILVFIFNWQERWMAFLCCILVANKLFSGIKMLKNPEPKSK